MHYAYEASLSMTSKIHEIEFCFGFIFHEIIVTDVKRTECNYSQIYRPNRFITNVVITRE